MLVIVRARSACALILDRRGAVTWESSAELSDDDLTAPLTSLLSGANRDRPRQVVVLVGASRSQLRVVAGLPKVDDVRVLSRIVSETPRRFFALAGAAVTGDVHRDSAGRHWCTAFDRALVTAAAAAAKTAKLRLAGLVSVLELLNTPLGASDGAYVDGDVACSIHFAGGRLERVVRRHTPGESADALGDQRAIELAAARRVQLRAPLAWRPPPTGALGGHARRVALLAAGAALFGVAASLAATAGIIRAGADAGVQVAASGDVPRNLAAATAQLEQATAAIDQVERFAAGRRSMSKVLRDIATVLPESTAITTLRVDSVGVILTAVAPHVADVVPALTGMPGVVMPQLTGSATREVIGGAQLERATLRFRFVSVRGARPSQRAQARRTP